MAIQSESAVNTANTVEVAIQFTIRVHQSQGGLLSNIATHATDGKERFLAG